MNLNQCIPSAAEIAVFREDTGVGMVEARRTLIKQRVLRHLYSKTCRPDELQQIIILILEHTL